VIVLLGEANRLLHTLSNVKLDDDVKPDAVPVPNGI
jgi:hypothetical protein